MNALHYTGMITTTVLVVSYVMTNSYLHSAKRNRDRWLKENINDPTHWQVQLEMNQLNEWQSKPLIYQIWEFRNLPPAKVAKYD